MALYHVFHFLLLGLVRNPETSNSLINHCSLDVRNGTVACRDAARGEVICHVQCDGTYKGVYRCSPHKGWSEKLPHCASHWKDLSSVATCRDDEMYSECQGHCEESCHRQDMPSSCTPKVCVGACVCARGLVRDQDGQCVPKRACTNPENPSAEARACNPEECRLDCSMFMLGGKCKDGQCKCGHRAPKEPSTEETECNLQQCHFKCSLFFMKGRCEGEGCKCSWKGIIYGDENGSTERGASSRNTRFHSLFQGEGGANGSGILGKLDSRLGAPKEPSTEETECNLMQCDFKCGVFYMKGRCEGKECKCSWKGITNRGEGGSTERGAISRNTKGRDNGSGILDSSSDPENPSAEATACNPEKCRHHCSIYMLGGKCKDGECRCGERAPVEKPSVDETGCDQQSCRRHCAHRGVGGQCINRKCQCFILGPVDPATSSE